MYIGLSLLVFVLSYNYVESANILIVYPIPGGRSHYILGAGVARVLVEAGHDVTLVSPLENKNPPKTGGKWTDIVLTGFMEETEKMFQNKSFFDIGSMPIIMNIPLLNGMGEDMVQQALKHPNVQKLIKSNAKFDVVIVEQFNNDALKGFASHFKAPLIVVSSLAPNGWVNSLVGNPGPLSYIPEILLPYSEHMTFCERVKNTLFAITMELNRNLYFFPRQNDIMHKYFPNPPHLNEILYNASIIFLNSHVSTSQPMPQVPAMIEIGGYHISPPKALPKDLQDFLDNAKEGVIYFSMGSIIKSFTMSEDRKKVIVNALSKLKQKVLWKWEEDVLSGQPKNVKTGKWLPQSDILAHKNVKLFITHGGLLSATETIYHGKPILALPIFGDQKMNAVAAINNGFALSLDFFNVKEDELVDTINELLNNPKYAQNVQTRSKIFHDRPISPQKTLVYWVEYVIRHGGAPHLRVAALDLVWYQYLLLDVFAFLIGTLVIVLLGFVFVVKKLCCKSNKHKPKGKEEKLKKK